MSRTGVSPSAEKYGKSALCSGDRTRDQDWLRPRGRARAAAWRPAIVLSPASYNRKTGFAIVAPITNKRKGYPFETALPAGLKVTGVALSDAIKNLDWRARNARYIEDAPPAVLADVREQLGLLLGFQSA
jgi:mRNA interferase MazF